ncbi:MAG: Amuc_1099 family pilus-like system protein [Verrucomicrobiota bacterium]|nr:Amuc_1099 family pilus-like system protein [Verrucomicrobiota bacterium]
MKAARKSRLGIEGVALLCLIVALAVSAGWVLRQVASAKARMAAHGWMQPEEERAAANLDFQRLETAVAVAEQPMQSTAQHHGLLVGGLRVVAIGSAYPIPYEAAVCPFSNIPQPAMNQLDRDGDGITDDWELKYGLDKYNAADAAADMDGDGFVNLEEFQAGTDPVDAARHPPYATKLLFVARKDTPLPYVFQGVTELPDGQLVFQINTPADGKTHFRSLGESLEKIVLQRFTPSVDGTLPRLHVMRGSTEIELVRGEKTADPESQAELINRLDRSPIIATMGALLSLRNDEYVVLGVYSDKVVVRHLGTGKVFDIVGLADGEPVSSPEDL